LAEKAASHSAFESIYSIDGDIAPIGELRDVAGFHAKGR
jgi:7-keto-8-aminopelargonate synthetase-like enzyme